MRVFSLAVLGAATFACLLPQANGGAVVLDEKTPCRVFWRLSPALVGAKGEYAPNARTRDALSPAPPADWMAPGFDDQDWGFRDSVYPGYAPFGLYVARDTVRLRGNVERLLQPCYIVRRGFEDADRRSPDFKTVRPCPAAGRSSTASRARSTSPARGSGSATSTPRPTFTRTTPICRSCNVSSGERWSARGAARAVHRVQSQAWRKASAWTDESGAR